MRHDESAIQNRKSPEAQRGIEPLIDRVAAGRLPTWLLRHTVDPGRLELPTSSLQARRYPSKPQAQYWFRGAESNRRSPGSQSGALPLSYREHELAPCQGLEPQLAASETAVLPLDEHGTITIHTPKSALECAGDRTRTCTGRPSAF